MFTITAGPERAAGRARTTVPTRVAGPPGRWPVPEERRTVSVLFADIVGSTALVDRLDPEDVRAMQRAYFDTVAGVLHRWNGVVEKYIGDAVMALFGATESDGFDAYRAVRAGLEIQRSLDRRSLVGGPALRVRVGVATGEAVVDLAATRDGSHGTASGAVITLAARLQEYAPPGGVALCAATHRATGSLIDQRPVPPVAVAGKALPLDVWHATGTARPTPARHTAPLVGRRRELAGARDQLVRAVRERRPRWVSVAGPAGSGRSRLLHELVRTVQSVDGVPVRWYVAACPPYPEQALAPIADQVRALAGIQVTDPPPVVRARLTDALSDLVPAARRTEAVYALEGLLAGPDTGSDARRGAAVWQECLLALAERQPVVVAVDDLDRGAPELGHALHRLVAAARTRLLPLAVVALHGPEWADTHPGDRDRRRPVPLRPLTTVESGRLLRHLLRRAGQPAPLAASLLPLVDGNPGRAVAYVATLGGSVDPARPPVPDPVRRNVDARLDRLDGPQRAVLMAAAVLGTPVDGSTVDRALGWTPGRAVAPLRELAARRLLVARPGGYAVPDPVVAEVAAGRLTRAARAGLLGRAEHRPRPAEVRPPVPSTAPMATPATTGPAARPTGRLSVAAPASSAAGRRPRLDRASRVGSAEAGPHVGSAHDGAHVGSAHASSHVGPAHAPNAGKAEQPVSAAVTRRSPTTVRDVSAVAPGSTGSDGAAARPVPAPSAPARGAVASAPSSSYGSVHRIPGHLADQHAAPVASPVRRGLASARTPTPHPWPERHPSVQGAPRSAGNRRPGAGRGPDAKARSRTATPQAA